MRNRIVIVTSLAVILFSLACYKYIRPVLVENAAEYEQRIKEINK